MVRESGRIFYFYRMMIVRVKVKFSHSYFKIISKHEKCQIKLLLTYKKIIDLTYLK